MLRFLQNSMLSKDTISVRVCDLESQLLATIITPFGRFNYLRAHYGISSISEHYNRRMDGAFAGLSGYRRVVEDVVIFDSEEGKHAAPVRQFFQKCAECMNHFQQGQVEVCLNHG